MLKANVVRLPLKKPRPDELMRVIRRLAAAGSITYSRHALEERMPERGFDVMDVERVLRLGEIQGAITEGQRVGEWQCLVVAKLVLGARDVGVATVVVRRERLIIKTVEWMDP